MKLAPIVLLAGFASCASSKHLIFFTNTTIGLEVSAEPNTTTPAKFVLGYKRQEGVIDPIMDPECSAKQVKGAEDGTTTTVECGNLMTEAHSVLAKMNFGASSGGTDATATQWFATGQAAIKIAEAPGIAGAVTGSAAIAEAVSKGPGLLQDKRISDELKTATLATAFRFIEGVGNAESAAVLARVGEFAQKFAKPEIPLYASGGPGSDIKNIPAGTAITPADYSVLGKFDQNVSNSIEQITALLASTTLKEAGQPTPPDQARRAQLLTERDLQQQRLREFREALHTSSEVISALEYFGRIVIGKECAK